jgi:hypothetical protein
MKPMALLLIALCAACGGSPTVAGAERPAAPGDWSCVAGAGSAEGGYTTLISVSIAPSPSASGAYTPFTVHLRDAATMADVGGVSLAACATLDLPCASPLTIGQADEYGLATLAVPGGLASFDGYLQVSGGGVPTNLLFLPGRTVAAASNAVELDVYTASALALTASQAGLVLQPQAGGVTLQPPLGIVRVDALDCDGTPARGVSVGVETGDGEAVTVYATGDGAGIARGVEGTDPTGVAFAFGVMEGMIGVTGRADGVPVAGTLGFARAGAVSSLVLRP